MKKSKQTNTLMQYAGLATQILVGLGFTIWLGSIIDKQQKNENPLFSWILPIILLLGLLIKIVKDTSKK